MTLPFELPSVSRGYAELSSAARAAGSEITASAAASLTSLLGLDVRVDARAVPGRSARADVARVGIDLPALPGSAVLEVEPALVASIVDRLAGGPGACAATALTAVETSALELLALAAVDGACRIPAVEEALSPRLSRGTEEPASALAVEITVSAGATAGRARLLVPPAAVRALRGAPDDAAQGPPLPASLQAGSIPVSAEELDALAPGDVLLLESPAEARALVLPGGFTLAGHLEEDAFHVEGMTMTERMLLVPVRLAVELARVDVTLADLVRLAPGAALPLALDRRGLVTLRVGEREVARGELVDVDGAVGVRVLSVEATP